MSRIKFVKKKISFGGNAVIQDKLFICPKVACSVTFVPQSALKVHMMKVHDEPTFECKKRDYKVHW